MLTISPTNRVNLIAVRVCHAGRDSIRDQIIANDFSAFGARHNLLSIARVFSGQNSSAPHRSIIPICSKIQNLLSTLQVQVNKTNVVVNTGVDQELFFRVYVHITDRPADVPTWYLCLQFKVVRIFSVEEHDVGLRRAVV